MFPTSGDDSDEHMINGRSDDSVIKRLDALNEKMERMSRHIDFIRTRLGIYLGDGVAMTYLADETLFFVNSNDIGTSVFIDGGNYEQDNLDVLKSFIRPDTVFLDIGANLGFFAVTLAKHITSAGKVHAFEPHPKVFELMKRTLFMNGLTDKVDCNNFGLSDSDGAVRFYYPLRHAGGGRVGYGNPPDNTITVQSQTKRVDGLFDADFTCDLVKIDVEGHELNVLRGMQGVIGRSLQIKILFEKFGRPEGSEADLKAFFEAFDMTLYGVGAGAILIELRSIESLCDWAGYVVATRAENLQGERRRSRFTIYPAQLSIPAERTHPVSIGHAAHFEGTCGQTLFYGPYWLLRRGTWQIRFDGSISGEIEVILAERGGHKVTALSVTSSTMDHVFVCERDLVNFECIARPLSATASVDLLGIELVRLG